jgi:hypothetical protein
VPRLLRYLLVLSWGKSVSLKRRRKKTVVALRKTGSNPQRANKGPTQCLTTSPVAHPGLSGVRRNCCRQRSKAARSKLVKVEKDQLTARSGWKWIVAVPPCAEHLVPLAKRQGRGLQQSLHFFFTLHAS